MSTRNRIFRNKRLPSERPLVSIIAALFNNNEQGLWYDIEGFRDSWGSVGPELLVNNDFSGGSSGWTVSNTDSTHVVTFSNGTCRYQSDTTSPTLSISQSNKLVVGNWYQVTVVVSSYVSGSIKTDAISNPVPNPVVGNGVGTFTIVGMATSTTFNILRMLAFVDMTIDSVSLKEWYGSSKCPLFQDSGGTVPVYLPGTGQVDPPVGLMLDRRFGLKRGSERFNDSSVLFSGESTRVSPGVYRCYSSTGTYNLINIGSMSVGSWYELQFTIDSVTNVGSGIVLEGTNSASNTIAWTTTGKKSIIVYASSNYIGFKRAGGAIDYQISNISLKELKGNHAYQTTTTSRPTLSARYNLLSYTDDFSNVVWGSSSNFSVTSGEVAPDGSNTAFKITSVSGAAATSQIVIAHPATPIKFVIYAKAGTYTNPNILIRNNTTATALISIGIAATSITSAYGTATSTDVGNGWKKVVCNITSGITSGDSIGYYYGATGAIPVGQYWYVWNPDTRQMNDRVNLPEYQRVNNPNIYDTNGFPLYLRFDGVDDWMQTSNVDFSTSDKILVTASITRLSDVGLGVIVESTTDYSTSNGTFVLLAPGSSGVPSVGFNTKGTNISGGLSYTTLAAPVGMIISGYADISGSNRYLRANSVQVSTSTVNIGTGNLGNYPLFIGRRAGTALPFKGKLYGLFIRAGNIFDSQIVKIEKFFNQKGKVY